MMATLFETGTMELKGGETRVDPYIRNHPFAFYRALREKDPVYYDPGIDVYLVTRYEDDRAWTTILDTHVTTIVSALILFFVGTGPVSGFGLTLIFGLLANLFTAVFVSRVIFDAVLSRKGRGEALSI